jgi:hypothetical protein
MRREEPEGMRMSDRIVHGQTVDHAEIVRYDRAGKWYFEWPDRLRPRRQVTIGEAARAAVEGKFYLGLYGGRVFDQRVRDRLDRRAPSGAGGTS